jgi:hypothetical protein
MGSQLETHVARELVVAFLLLAGGCDSRAVTVADRGLPATDAALDAEATLSGLFHLQMVDAVNLSLEPDKTFYWAIDGCDFFGGDCGTLLQMGVDTMLVPSHGSSSFTWVHGGSFATQVVEVILRAGPTAGQATAQGVLTDGGTFTQIWTSGRVCAKCGGMGPISLYPCPGPLPRPTFCD